jgi:hypothetical protein
MDTMVWSMNVIATAKIMAARTKFLDRPPVTLVTVMAPSLTAWCGYVGV